MRERSALIETFILEVRKEIKLGEVTYSKTLDANMKQDDKTARQRPKWHRTTGASRWASCVGLPATTDTLSQSSIVFFFFYVPFPYIFICKNR